MKNLKQARKAKGMTQDEIAALIGLSRQAYASYETGFRDPDTATLAKLARILDVTTDYLVGNSEALKQKDRFIPLLGTVPAGVPIEAIEDIEEYIDIYPRFVKHGELFALRVQGDSMEPDIRNGDIAIIEKQDNAESGSIAVVRVNGEDVTVKKIRVSQKGLMLIPLNPAYDPVFFDQNQIATLPVTIIGKVIEIRRRL